MATIKTQPTQQSVSDFLASIEPPAKREDSLVLLELFKRVTGEEPLLWSNNIIGFGVYHYKSERSKQEGDWMIVGFSPRKSNLTLYIMHGNQDNPALSKLGKYTTGMGCMYVSRLANIDMELLPELIKKSYDYTKGTAI